MQPFRFNLRGVTKFGNYLQSRSYSRSTCRTNYRNHGFSTWKSLILRLQELHPGPFMNGVLHFLVSAFDLVFSGEDRRPNEADPFNRGLFQLLVCCFESILSAQ